MTKKEQQTFEEYAELIYNTKDTEEYCNLIIEYEDKLCKIINKNHA